jgi:Zn-dependent protease with chaperone function
MYIVAPVWIAPITDNFEPLANKELALRISSLAARAGIPNALVLVKDQSHTSRIPNAQVRGMLGTERIVLFDTMSDPASERELLVLVGHEMGHYVAGDMWKFVALQLSFVLLGLWLTDRLAPAAVRRFGPRWGFTTLCSPGSLPFLYLTFNLVVLATTPVVNNLVRNAERDADRFALDLTHDGEAAQSLAIKYMQIALDVPKPGPFRRIFRMDHPSFDERVRFAIHYHPWTQNSDIAR